MNFLPTLRWRHCAATSLATLSAAHALAQTAAEPATLPRVEVIGVTPLPGLGTPLRDVPSNVQVFRGSDLARQHQGNLAEFLENNPSSVSVNAAQGNPYQLDISFRGFTASPLIGVPQGLSVFQDGVRINEPFGDVVNWDLLPQSAIGGIQIIPGSNPLFGLNTLGGALSIITKSGKANPGGSAEISAGSFGRTSLEYEQGGESGPWDWFTTANVSKERGWAQHNPSRVTQFYGKGGYEQGGHEFNLSVNAASTRLEGTQTLPGSFLDDRTQAYTFPDLNENRVLMLAATARNMLTPTLVLGSNAYVRRYTNHNTSSNVNGDYNNDPLAGPLDLVEALNDRSSIEQTSYGLGAQLTLTQPIGDMKNQFVVGASGDFGRAHFTQESQDAAFTPSRGAMASGDFAPVTDAQTRNQTLAAFAADTLALTPLWSVTGSGRFNAAKVQIRDRSGTAPGLDGDNSFRRFNPALGLNFNPDTLNTFYAGVNEGMRAPTAIELTCADPQAPCKLPNSFLADPPLKKVVARTIEVGARGKVGADTWSVAVYRTDLQDDIQFVSSGGAINAGFFQNVGKTRRQGVELTGGKRFGPVNVVVRYSFIDAIFVTPFTENSPNNSSADPATGDIVVPAGARIPGIPRQTLRLRLEAEPTEKWQLGANLVFSGSSRARGDENNLDANGKVAGYGVLNLDSEYDLGKGFELFARINNVTDRKYANFGILGQNAFPNPSRTFDPANGTSETFLGLGAPRGVWVGLRYEWD